MSAAEVLPVERRDGFVGDLLVVEVDHPHPGLACQGGHDVGVVDVAQVHQQTTDGLLAALLKLKGLVNLVPVHLLQLREHPSEPSALQGGGISGGVGHRRTSFLA